jgi:hypothetical protein
MEGITVKDREQPLTVLPAMSKLINFKMCVFSMTLNPGQVHGPITKTVVQR